MTDGETEVRKVVRPVDSESRPPTRAQTCRKPESGSTEGSQRCVSVCVTLAHLNRNSCHRFCFHPSGMGMGEASSTFSNFSLEPNTSVVVGKGVGSENEAMIELLCSRHF